MNLEHLAHCCGCVLVAALAADAGGPPACDAVALDRIPITEADASLVGDALVIRAGGAPAPDAAARLQCPPQRLPESPTACCVPAPGRP